LLTTAGLTLVILAFTGSVAAFRFGSLANALAFVRGERLLLSRPAMGPADASTDGRITLRYEITNLTGRPIQLVGSRSSCSCTVVGDLPATIADRETFAIPIGVTLPEPPKRASGTVTLFTGDPEYPEVKLAFAMGDPR